MTKKQTRKTKNKGNHYLTNADLLPVLLNAKKLGRVTPELAKMFIKLVNRYSEHPWFSGYSSLWLDEMRGEAILALCKGALKFDESYAIKNGKTPQPFSYCTTIVYRAFKAQRDRDKKFTDAQDKIPRGLY